MQSGRPRIFMEGFVSAHAQRGRREEAVTSVQDHSGLEDRLARARWVRQHVFPHDLQMRNWFRKRGISEDDINEAMQEAYYRIAKLDEVEPIANPGAYFFSIARNFAIQRLKQLPVVPFETLSEMDSAHLGMESPIDETVHIRLSYDKVRAMIAALPERCRAIVELRKVENWSQKEIAQHFGITEKAVEKQVWLGIRAVREAWRKGESAGEARLEAIERRGMKR